MATDLSEWQTNCFIAPGRAPKATRRHDPPEMAAVAPRRGPPHAAASIASSSSIMPEMTERPLPQKAGSRASSPNGASSSE